MCRVKKFTKNVFRAELARSKVGYNKKMIYEIVLSTLKLFSSIFHRKLEKIDRLKTKAEFYSSSKPKIKPLRLYWIDPDEIIYATEETPKSYFRLSPVIDGSWDKNKVKLDSIDLVYSIEKHFNENKEWQNTDFYKRAKECIEDQDKEWNGRIRVNNLERFKSYLQRIDLLHQNITEDGYKTQRALDEDRGATLDFKHMRDMKLL